MDNQYRNDEVTSLRQKFEELEEKYKEMEEKHKEIQEKCKEMERLHQDVSSSTQSIMPEIKKCIGKLENQKTIGYKDINNKLSDYVQNIIQASKGPLKPHELCKFLVDDVFTKQNRKISIVLKKYTNDALGVKKQLVEVLQSVENHIEYRKKQEKLDCNFIKAIKKLEKKIEEETKVMASKKSKGLPLKKQKRESKKKNSLDIVEHINNGIPNKVTQKASKTQTVRQKRESKKNSSLDVIKQHVNEVPNKVVQQVTETQTVKGNRKRKFEQAFDSCSSQESSATDSSGIQENGFTDSCSSQENGFTDSCSSQESGVTHLTRSLGRKLKIVSSEESTNAMSIDDSSTDDELTSDSKRKLKNKKSKGKLSETSDSGIGKSGSSSSSENELTMSERPLFIWK